MHDYDVEILEENGALTLLPDNAEALLEVEVPGEQGIQGVTGSTGMIKVVHGSDPNVVRPTAPVVYWVGSVNPVNADPDDLLMLRD